MQAMTTDIVERLRGPAPHMIGPLMDEAADEIERLRAIADTTDIMTAQAIKRQNEEIARLKAQLARTETALDNEFNNGIALCAEIEQLQKLCATYKQIALPGDDGTVVAVGGEPGASAGKSE